ncbi:MAG: PAS domain-containing protein, partial [Thaumarchaeota archaeon]|nr:PAS domain-containing protein [Nitrososphaerota archaeon]
RAEEAKILATNEPLQNIVEQANKKNDGEFIDDSQLEINKKNFLETEFLEFSQITGGSKDGFSDITAYDKQGRTVLSTGYLPLEEVMTQEYIFSNGMKKTFYFIDSLSDVQSVRNLVVVTPLFPHDKVHSEPIGVLLIVMPTISSATNISTLGKTGELLIVDNHGHFVTKPRFTTNTISSEILAARPASECFENGNDFTGKWIDSRSNSVYGSSRCEISKNLLFIAKINTDEVLSPINHQRDQAIITALIVGIISVFLVFVTSRSITKRITLLRNITHEIADGNFNAGVSMSGNDEISDLSTDFNKMILALKKSQKETKDIMKLLDRSALVSITDKGGNIIYANDMFCKVSKYTHEELIGQNHRILKSGFHPPEFYTDLWKTISSGNIWQNVIKNKAKDGTYYWVKTIIMPVFDKKGEIEKYISIRTDITNEIKMKDKLLKQEKMASIGELATRIAHDLRNPLSIIKNTMELFILKNPTLGQTSKREIERLDRATRRMVHQVDEVLDFVRPKPLVLVKTSILNILHQTMDRVLKLDTVTIHLPKNDADVIVDAEKLEIVFVNLISNAIQAMQNKGQIDIRIKDDGDYVLIEIEDNGPGIPRDVMSKIFDPLFTTKQTGTGLGLVSCKSIMERHHGSIGVKSIPGKGTTFILKIPRQETSVNDSN